MHPTSQVLQYRRTQVKGYLFIHSFIYSLINLFISVELHKELNDEMYVLRFYRTIKYCLNWKLKMNSLKFF